MHSPAFWILAAFLGLALGALFYGGLWWTVHWGATIQRPALWFGCSLLLRFGVVLAGFYLVGSQHGLLLLPCLIGFFSGRVLVAVFTRERRGGHAS